MKNAGIFAAGVFFGCLVVAMVASLLHGRNVGSTVTVLPGIVLYAVAAWFFFALGASMQKKVASAGVVFILGTVAALVQSGVAFALLSGVIPEIQSMIGIIAFLIVPLALCSLLAPFVPRASS